MSRMAHIVPPVLLTARLPWPSIHCGSDILSPIVFLLSAVANPSYSPHIYFHLEAGSALRQHSCSISFAGGGLGHHSSCLFVFSIDFFLGSRLISSACTTSFFFTLSYRFRTCASSSMVGLINRLNIVSALCVKAKDQLIHNTYRS